MQQSKQSLRKQLLSDRESMSRQILIQKNQNLCSRLLGSDYLSNAQTVLGYFSTRFEPDLSWIYSLQNHRWGFPRIKDKSLQWHLWNPGDQLELNRYGIWEPSSSLPILTRDQVDLILVPSIACDLQGYRLGYGGGYYDRLLDQAPWSSISTIGITFALTKQLPTDSWDRKLKSICTDKELIYI